MARRVRLTFLSGRFQRLANKRNFFIITIIIRSAIFLDHFPIDHTLFLPSIDDYSSNYQNYLGCVTFWNGSVNLPRAITVKCLTHFDRYVLNCEETLFVFRDSERRMYRFLKVVCFSRSSFLTIIVCFDAFISLTDLINLSILTFNFYKIIK